MSETRLPTGTRKTALAPDLRQLDERAARAWIERMAVTQLGETSYTVDSQSGSTYVVDLADRSCTCPDHQIRGEVCKHMRRVALEISMRRVAPPGKHRVSCDACDVETFAPTDDERPHLCATCELEPGDVVRDRETDDRLVVARVTPERSHEVWIDGADTTVADYETNEDYPPVDLVVEAVYLGDVGRQDDPRRYSFPLSRLERVDDAAVVDSGFDREFAGT